MQRTNKLNQSFIMGLNGYLIRIQFRLVHLTFKIIRVKRLLLEGRQGGRDEAVTFY